MFQKKSQCHSLYSFPIAFEPWFQLTCILILKMLPPIFIACVEGALLMAFGLDILVKAFDVTNI